jgi:hypothetical protein
MPGAAANQSPYRSSSDSAISGDGAYDGDNDIPVTHRPLARNRQAAVVVRNKQAVVERHRPLAGRVRYLG